MKILNKKLTFLGIILAIIISLIVVSIIGVVVIDNMSNLINKSMEDLRSKNSPTKHEYKVISVEYMKPWIGIDYYEVTYVGENNILSSKKFYENDILRVIISNESKLVIENPELNGYPLKYTLYWNKLD